MRELGDVLDRIMEECPSLRDALAKTRSSCNYAAPEAKIQFWKEAQDLLEQHCPPEHPDFETAVGIFAGTAPAPDP